MLSNIEELARAWARLMAEVEFPSDYDGTATPAAHHASEIVQEQIRDHVMATNDMRLFSLLHLLGQASLSMEQIIWPEQYERIRREVGKTMMEADNPDTKWISHEEVMQTMRRKIKMAKDKPC